MAKSDRLIKSDDSFKRGWTGEIPKIELDLSGKIAATIEKHLSALNWTLLGDLAGKKAIEAAADLRIKTVVSPGVLISSYLNSIDSHMSFYRMFYGNKPEDMPKFLLQHTMNEITKQTNMYLEQFIPQLRNALINVIKTLSDDVNNKYAIKVHRTASNIIKEGVPAPEAIEDTIQQLELISSRYKLNQELTRVGKKFESNWKMAAGTEISKASAVGTHQAMLEVFGKKEDRLRVAIIVTEDERLCQFCNKISKNDDGGVKIYNLSELKPSGYNMSRKKDQWKPALPPLHPHCFDKETEVLTDEGWKKFENVSGLEKFLSIDIETGSAEWVKAKNKIAYKYEGVMHYFKSNNADFCTTPEHNHVVKLRHRKNNSFQLIKGVDLPEWDVQWMATIPNWQGKKEEFIKFDDFEFNSIDFMRFIGVYLSEGSAFITKDGYKKISIHQEKYHKEMYEIVYKIFGNKTNSRPKNGKIDIYMSKNNELFQYLHKLGHSHEKYIPPELKEYDKEHLEEFLKWFIKGDGSTVVAKSLDGYKSSIVNIMSTSSIRLEADLSELILKIGKRPSFAIQYPKAVKHKNGEYTSKYPQHIISVGEKQNHSSSHVKKHSIPYNDMVYCVELEKFHTLITRRNGKIVVSGNCRCVAVYIPPGYTVDKLGNLIKK